MLNILKRTIKDFLKRIIRKTVNLFGYQITTVSDIIMDKDERFKRIYDKSKECTLTSKERMYALYKSVEYMINAKLPGDFVECGVWKGGSTMLIAYTLLELNESNRKIYLYDTYTGMSEPTENDYALLNKNFRLLNGRESKGKIIIIGLFRLYLKLKIICWQPVTLKII